jgi:hypothetical protein
LFLVSCSGNSNDTPQQTEVSGHYLWPGYTLEEAVNVADHIVHGKIKEKKALVERQDLSKKTIVENDLEIEIIRVLKESESISRDAEIVIYHEIPIPTGEDRSDIPINLDVGQEVILFLNSHSRVLGPDYVILVDDSNIQLASYLLDEKNSHSQSTYMSVKEFYEKIRND